MGYHTDKLPEVRAELLSEEGGYEIYCMQFEVLEGLYMTGLFFKDSGAHEFCLDDAPIQGLIDNIKIE